MTGCMWYHCISLSYLYLPVTMHGDIISRICLLISGHKDTAGISCHFRKTQKTMILRCGIVAENLIHYLKIYNWFIHHWHKSYCNLTMLEQVPILWSHFTLLTSTVIPELRYRQALQDYWLFGLKSVFVLLDPLRNDHFYNNWLLDTLLNASLVFDTISVIKTMSKSADHIVTKLSRHLGNPFLLVPSNPKPSIFGHLYPQQSLVSHLIYIFFIGFSMTQTSRCTCAMSQTVLLTHLHIIWYSDVYFCQDIKKSYNFARSQTLLMQFAIIKLSKYK